MSFTRDCPTCGKSISYKKKKYMRSAERKNSECKSCSHKGNSHSEDHKEKISQSLKETMGSEDWEHHLEGKTYEEAYGEEKAEKIRKDISDGNEGKTVSIEGRRNIAKAKMGKKNPMYGNHEAKSKEHRRKIRKSCIKTLQQKHDDFSPSHNPDACEFIESYGKEHDYDFKHAENGGEHYIEELGYWVDGYDEEQNVVIEYYEPAHRKTKRKKRDERRKQEILEHLNCKFIEYHEWDDRILISNK